MHYSSYYSQFSYSIYLTLPRSSLAFAQEVQKSKEMDDLMGKVTNLFAGNTESVPKGKIILKS